MDDTDFRRFMGPVADRYLAPERRRLFDHMRACNFALWPPPRSFCWPALFVPTQWMLYRKLYLAAAWVLLLSVVWVAAMPTAMLWLTLPLGLASALLGHPLFLRKIARDIAMADRLGLTGAARDLYAAQVGGRSAAGLGLGWAYIGAGFVLGLVGGVLQAMAVKVPALFPALPRVAPLPVPLGALSVLCVVVPSLLWLAYGFRRLGLARADRIGWTCVALGMMAAGLAALIEAPILQLLALGAKAGVDKAIGVAITAGMVEEAVKLFVLAALVVPFAHGMAPRRWSALGMLLGIGFGALESMSALSNLGYPALGLLRGTTAMPMHACLGLALGWLYAHWGKPGPWRALRLIGVWMAPAMLHIAYDAPVLRGVTEQGNIAALVGAAPTLGIVVLIGLLGLRDQGAARSGVGTSVWLGALLLLQAPALILAVQQSPALLAAGAGATTGTIIGLVALIAIAPVILASEWIWRARRVARLRPGWVPRGDR